MKSRYRRDFRISATLCPVVLPILLFTCRSPQNVHSVDLAKEIHGSNFEEIPNGSGSYILFVEKQGNNAFKAAQSFIVIRTSDNKIVYRSKFLPGYVKWHSETSIEILNEPGMVKENESAQDYIKILDIRKPEF